MALMTFWGVKVFADGGLEMSGVVEIGVEIADALASLERRKALKDMALSTKG